MFSNADRTFSISIELEGPNVLESAVMENDFPYTLYLEAERFSRSRVLSPQYPNRRQNVFSPGNLAMKERVRAKRPSKELDEEWREGKWKLGVSEHLAGSTIWSTSDTKEIAEILGSIVEHEGFEEKVTVKSNEESKTFESVIFRHLSTKEKKVFKQVLEEKILNTAG